MPRVAQASFFEAVDVAVVVVIVVVVFVVLPPLMSTRLTFTITGLASRMQCEATQPLLNSQSPDHRIKRHVSHRTPTPF